MNAEPEQFDGKPLREWLTSDVMILPDGQILAHNLSQAMAEVLAQLNPADETIHRRATRHFPKRETDNEQMLQAKTG